MNRQLYNRFEQNLLTYQNDRYFFNDYALDQSYSEDKPRDTWVNLTDPPYIISGLSVSLAANPLLVNVEGGIAYDKSFHEINTLPKSNLAPVELTSGVVNYLVVEHRRMAVPGTERTTIYNNITYPAIIEDSYIYKWKLSAPINPEFTGINSEPFDIIKDVNDRILFATDQSTPEYEVLLTPNAASITSEEYLSSTLTFNELINDSLFVQVDGFVYSFNFTDSASEDIEVSGVVNLINTQAYLQNGLLAYDLAHQISGETRIRITSPRDGAPFAGKHVYVLSGSAINTLGLTSGESVNEIAARTATNIVDDINIVTNPEITAEVISSKVQLQAQDPQGYLEILPTPRNAYDTLGVFLTRVEGANTIDFNNDVILCSVYNNGGVLEIENTHRTKTLKFVTSHNGWEYQQTVSGISGEPDDVYITIPNGDYYIVGANELEVYKNGVRMYAGKGFDEIGSPGDKSTEFIAYNCYNQQELLFRLPQASTAPVRPIIAQEGGIDLIRGVTTFNFRPEFDVSVGVSGELIVGLNIYSGSPVGSGAVLADHGSMHEYGGPMEIDVTNLKGLLTDPQKTYIYSLGQLTYAATGLNFTDSRFVISDSGSGFINVGLDEKVFTDPEGNAVIRLGIDGGTVTSGLIVQDQVSGTWFISVDNEGRLLSESFAGVPQTVILESDDTSLYQLSVEAVLGSGEITSETVISGSPWDISLEAPNGKAWKIGVENDGTLFTIDPDNVFEVQNADGNTILQLTESGVLHLHRFEYGVASGDFRQLPEAGEASGGIALYQNSSGEVRPVFSNGSGWMYISLEPFVV